MSLFFLLFLLISPGVPAEEGDPIREIARYFPDEVGRTWKYEGSVVDEVQRIASYTNIATVQKRIERNGVEVMVFTETNQANRGLRKSFFLRDEGGIVYHGGEPTTPFESQLVPYQVVKFPMTLDHPYSQIEKKNVAFGLDLDLDGKDEQADVSAHIVAEKFETVSVPAGVFPDSLKIVGTLVIRITLSGNQEVVEMTDQTINWFVMDIGLVKGIERATFPRVGGFPGTGSITIEMLSGYSNPETLMF
ncbi:MAG: hypothetical protein ABGX83_02500 [Nitrospira sp.]|nr:hypothetical protein [Candidatus Manganitrophaceae bacterium]HIL35221.1 hypothetical protein [Candidatus Manganitrophaceae bacterium]